MKRLATILFFATSFCFAAFAQTHKEELQTIDSARFVKEIWNFNKSDVFKYKGKKPILIDFNATWCNPCKAIHPYLVELQEEYGDKITIYSIDVDKEPGITDAFKITNIPALIFVKDKNTVYFKSVGKKTKEEIKNLIETKLLKN